jgi:hypothetical protein
LRVLAAHCSRGPSLGDRVASAALCSSQFELGNALRLEPIRAAGPKRNGRLRALRLRLIGEKPEDDGLGRFTQLRFERTAVSPFKDDALYDLKVTLDGTRRKCGAGLVRRDDDPEGHEAAVKGSNQGRAAASGDLDRGELRAGLLE